MNQARIKITYFDIDGLIAVVELHNTVELNFVGSFEARYENGAYHMTRYWGDVPTSQGELDKMILSALRTWHEGAIGQREIVVNGLNGPAKI